MRENDVGYSTAFENGPRRVVVQYIEAGNQTECDSEIGCESRNVLTSCKVWFIEQIDLPVFCNLSKKMYFGFSQNDSKANPTSEPCLLKTMLVL